MEPIVAALAATGFFLLLLACFGWNQPRPFQSVENWSHVIDGLREPADLFYARVYQQLKNRLGEANLPGARVDFGSGHLFGNRTIFGPRPEYIVVRYARLTIYIYAHSINECLYVTYWAFSKDAAWEKHPVLRWLLFLRLYQMTLFQFDVSVMCMSTIHGALHDVLDAYAEERQLTPLADYERRPVRHNFYGRFNPVAAPAVSAVPQA